MEEMDPENFVNKQFTKSKQIHKYELKEKKRKSWNLDDVESVIGMGIIGNAKKRRVVDSGNGGNGPRKFGSNRKMKKKTQNEKNKYNFF